MKSIVVIGSINVDFVTQVERRPQKGETLMGAKFQINHGGKGANQAIAASRLGADVHFIGCVGDDVNGDFAIENLIKNKVNTKGVSKIKNTETGIANIILSEGDNSIIVVPGANFKLTKEHINQYMEIILNASLVLMQLEIPMEVIEYVVDICHSKGIITILNPAPAKVLTSELVEKVDYLTPNEHEFELVFNTTDLDAVLSRYPNKLVVTRGEEGVCFYDIDRFVEIKPYLIDVVDTTGAGDTFNGAFAYSLVEGIGMKDAIELANKAAALSVTKMGAQGGMPTLREVETL